MSETKVYDIFLSYKTRKYLALAVWLYERFTAAGYRVWFDRKVLEQKEITGREYTKKELIDVLTQAASHAKCSVILEAELELVLLLPGMTREYALTNLLAMEDDSGALIDWNWQKLEIDSSDRSIAIYYSVQKCLLTDMTQRHSLTSSRMTNHCLLPCERVSPNLVFNSSTKITLL
jgi:hypothetical protein